jgi:hypothetical protein
MQLKYYDYYSEDDYKGEFNLLRSEKELTAKAYQRAKGDVREMSRLLEVSEERVLLLIFKHRIICLYYFCIVPYQTDLSE